MSYKKETNGVQHTVCGGDMGSVHLQDSQRLRKKENSKVCVVD